MLLNYYFLKHRTDKRTILDFFKNDEKKFVFHFKFCKFNEDKIIFLDEAFIMMNNAKRMLGAFLILVSSIYATERVYLAPFSMVGLNENFALPAEKLMNAYIEDDNRFVLVNYTEEDSIKAGDRDAANKKAIEKHCSKFIIAEFTRLGENVITSFKLYDVNNESPIWSDRLKAKNPDDLDPIIQRVARNIGTGNKAVDDDDILSVTAQETKKPRKKSISSYIGAQISLVTALNPDVQCDGGFGLFLFYDARNFLFSLDWTMNNIDAKETSRPRLSGISLSGYYPFGTKNITPFLGAGLAYSRRTLDIDIEGYDRDHFDLSSSGVSVELGGGIIFNRASRVMFIADAKYFIDCFKSPFLKSVNEKTYSNSNYYDRSEYEVKTKNYYLTGFKFNLGLAFGI